MKNHGFALITTALIAFSACSDGAGPTGSPSSGGRIEAGLAGTWIDNAPFFADTIIFAEDRIRVPYFSAVGTQFSAKEGLVKGGPDNRIFGEYLRSGDTLYYDALLGEVPDGVDKSTAGKYLKQ